MSPYNSKLIALLAAKVNPLPQTVEGFSSLHPIMRMRAWIDRRLSKRKRVQLSATINTGGTVRHATVVDMSSTGAGIIGIEGLKTGDMAIVTVEAAKPLNCEVVWASDNRAGVRFIQPN